MTASVEPQNPIRRQAQTEDSEESAAKKRQRRGIEKASADKASADAVEQDEAEAAGAAAVTPFDPLDGIELGDRTFEDVTPDPPAANTQPPTTASRAAVAQEAVIRGKAAGQALRDVAVSNRLFSGKNAKTSPKHKAAILSDRHNQYAQLMALNCIKPLAQGIDPSTLTAAVSTTAVMWALSPRFREVMAEYNTKINDVLRFTRAKSFAKNKQVPLGSNRTTVAKAQTVAAREDKAMLDQVSAVLQGAEEVPFSTESAAMSLLQIHEDAYVAIREGEDEVTVTTDLSETVEALTHIWESQKLDPQLVTATARTLLGYTEGDDDLRLAQFVETSGGTIRPAQQVATKGVGGVTVASWGGQWSFGEGRILNNATAAMFTVRGVGDARSHQKSLSKLVFQDLELASKSGPAELYKAVIGHRAAWELREVKLDVGGVGGASRDRAAACAQRSRVAYTAMVDDGIQEGLRQKVAANALLMGLKTFEEEYPQLAEGMVKKFGEGHSDVAAMVTKGKERGRYAPLRPLVFNPSNPIHVAQMGQSQVLAELEDARELGTEPPRQSVLGGWGPRAHPDVLEAERTQGAPDEEMRTPLRGTKTEQGPLVRRGVDKQEQVGDPLTPNQPVQLWQLISPKENIERQARGFDAAERVPYGMKPIPSDQAGYEREVAKRTRLEKIEARFETLITEAAGHSRDLQDEAAVRSAQPPLMPGPNTATVGQRHQAEANNSSYDRAGRGPEAKSVAAWDDPRTNGVEGKPALTTQERARRARQASTQQLVENSTPKPKDKAAGPELGA